MKENIQEIFKSDIELLGHSEKAVAYIRRQDYYTAFNFCTKTIDAMTSLIQHVIDNQDYFNEDSTVVDSEYINVMLSGLLSAQEYKDYTLVADLLEIQVIPFVLNLQEVIINKEEFIFDQVQYEKNISLIKSKDKTLGKLLEQGHSPLELLEEGYYVEYSSCGLMTIALLDKSKKYYLHTNGQVTREAAIIAREWFSDDITEYLVFGLGFGYHIMELAALDDTISIQVFESDINIIKLACGFTNLESLFSYTNVRLIYDPDCLSITKSISSMSQETSFAIHYPSLRNIKNGRIREQMEDIFVLHSSVAHQRHKLNNNFKNNIKLGDNSVDELKKSFFGKDLYIVAAGPSLDKNFLRLKDIGENAVVLCTGTAFKKLVDAGIKPDYVIIIDANTLVYRQIEGMEQNAVPLLYLSTVYYKVPLSYEGKRYLICQKGFDMAEEYAEKKGYSLFQTGGSVSTTALDLGISFRCRRIIYLGLDLAYTDNQDHAFGTASVNKIESKDLRQVKDISGNMIATSKNLDIYRKWIEGRIENVTEIEFIDATEGGAMIQGMKIMPLTDAIRSGGEICVSCNAGLSNIENKYGNREVKSDISEIKSEIMTGKKKFVFDIDGVIAKIQKENNYALAEPNEPMIDIINKLYQMGNQIVLFTARGYATGIDWKDVTVKQLNDWNLHYHELHFGKPNADYYIDDKSLDLAKLIMLFHND